MFARVVLSSRRIVLSSCSGSVASRSIVSRACVVGAGPAGFYATQELLRAGVARVDLVERYPSPYGLVRSGIAPDHEPDKRVAAEFVSTLQRDDVRFFGNVNVASAPAQFVEQPYSTQTVTLQQLRADYPVVVLAHGSQGDRLLHVPNETRARGVHSARAFAAWYNNAHQQLNSSFPDDLQLGDSAVIVGNGNVAIDVARILIKSLDELKTSDIGVHATKALQKSRVKHLHIMGRRGIEHASFSNRELRELLNLPNVLVRLELGSAELSLNDIAKNQKERTRKRQMKLWQSVETKTVDDPEFTVTFHFWRSIDEIALNQDDTIQNVSFSNNVDERQEGVRLDASLLFRSIGFDAIPCDAALAVSSNGALKNDRGKIENMPGVYTCGWLKRGPSGIVGSNKFCAQDTVNKIMDDFKDVEVKQDIKSETCLDILSTNSVLSSSEWLACEEFEVLLGAKHEKPRLKLRDAAQLLQYGKTNALQDENNNEIEPNV